ncbi:MAG: hypothetical protein AB7O44_04565 [Hyphomicrobiaceae bacterium]
MTVIGKLFAVSAAAALLFSTHAIAQEKKPAAAPKPAAAASPCKGIDETACKGNTACQWIAPKKGKQKPYCKLKAKAKKATPKS